MSKWRDRVKERQLPQELGRWGKLFQKVISQHNPSLVKELQEAGDLKAFLLVQQADALEDVEEMVGQGTPADLANEVVANQFLEMLVPQQPPEDPEAEEMNAAAIVDRWMQDPDGKTLET